MQQELKDRLRSVLENPKERKREKEIAKIILEAMYQSEQLGEQSGSDANYFDPKNPLANKCIRKGSCGQIEIMDQMIASLIRILFPGYI